MCSPTQGFYYPQDQLHELPPHAVSRTNGELKVGAELHTKDGRVIGNAVAINKYMRTEYEPIEFSQEVWVVMTDIGQTMEMTEKVLLEKFWVGEYVLKVTDAIYARSRPSDVLDDQIPF